MALMLRRLHAAERGTLILLWAVVVTCAAAGLAVLVADIMAGDWRYGTIAQLLGIAASVGSTSLLLATTHRLMLKEHDLDDIVMERGAGVGGTRADSPGNGADPGHPTPLI
jgi:methyl coenzyme M reductase subunit C-like uncharacterized protein (methanogenesis marker protein 7)